MGITSNIAFPDPSATLPPRPFHFPSVHLGWYIFVFTLDMLCMQLLAMDYVTIVSTVFNTK